MNTNRLTWDEDDQNNRILRDGEHIGVSLQMMDAVQREVVSALHTSDAAAIVEIRDGAGEVVLRMPRGALHRPGARFPVNSIRDRQEAIRQTHIAMQADAWRDQRVDRTPIGDAKAARNRAYDEYACRLANAWRGKR